MTTQVDNPTTVTEQPTQAEQIEALSQYRYGWHDSDLAGTTQRALSWPWAVRTRPGCQ